MNRRTRWRNPALIPNEEGLAVEVLLPDGTWTATVVERTPEGLHRLKDIPVAGIVGWRFP